MSRGRPLQTPDEGPRHARTIRLTNAVWEQVQAAAARRGVSAATWVEQVLRRTTTTKGKGAGD